jgi:hypothetical protein
MYLSTASVKGGHVARKCASLQDRKFIFVALQRKLRSSKAQLRSLRLKLLEATFNRNFYDCNWYGTVRKNYHEVFFILKKLCLRALHYKKNVKTCINCCGAMHYKHNCVFNISLSFFILRCAFAAQHL